jgi:hypothetical protein
MVARYPDTYEIGLPNQGLQILYEILNERDDAVAERTYAPWRDLEVLMREHRVPLFSVDSHRPADEFDLLAFNLSSELVYTNVLNMIDLAGVPVRADERRPEHPLVVIGGHAAFNPEPLADFVDSRCSARARRWSPRSPMCSRVEGVGSHRSRAGAARIVQGARRVRAVDVRGRLRRRTAGVAVEPKYSDVPATVDKRTVADLGEWPYPKRPLAPLTEVVHDRLSVEVFRGCTRGCRFCQAGMITRPVRERPADQVRTMIRDGLRSHRIRRGQPHVAVDRRLLRHRTGGERHPRRRRKRARFVWQHHHQPALAAGRRVHGRPRRRGQQRSPQRAHVRARGRVVAAAHVINKLITEDDLYGAVESAYSQGWTRIKLYFLTGLPTETDDDTLGIAELVRNCAAIGRRTPAVRRSPSASAGSCPSRTRRSSGSGRTPPRSCSARSTCCERHPQGSRAPTSSGTTRRPPWPRASRAAATVGSVGSSSACGAMAASSRSGASASPRSVDRRHGGRGALARLVRAPPPHESEVLPWAHLTAGLHQDFLWDDWQAALAGSGLEDCRWTPCYDCGVCTGFGIEHVVASPVPPAGGSQGTGQDLSRAGEVPVTLMPARSGAPV